MSETPAPILYNWPPEQLHVPVAGDWYHDQLDNLLISVVEVTTYRVFYTFSSIGNNDVQWMWRKDFVQSFRWTEMPQG